MVVIRESNKQFHSVKQQMKRNDVKEIVIATDSAISLLINNVHYDKFIPLLYLSKVRKHNLKCT
ncbi:hypothetical protein J2X83_006079 [Brevibacillus nitrificans]|nr:hypothetical protein [Brevibacillus nitrificans]